MTAILARLDPLLLRFGLAAARLVWYVRFILKKSNNDSLTTTRLDPHFDRVTVKAYKQALKKKPTTVFLQLHFWDVPTLYSAGPL